MQSELKPCPFCGGEAKLISDWASTVQCQNDQCIIGDPAPFNDFSHRTDAITAWNTRTTPAAAADREAIARIISLVCLDYEDGVAGIDPGDCYRAADEILALRPADQGEKWVCVPREPTEAMWDGLARAIVMWMDMQPKTPRALFQHLQSSGFDVPQWLRDEPEMKALDHVPSKGTRAVIIYRAMLFALDRKGAAS